MDTSILHDPIFLFLVGFVALVWFLTNAFAAIGLSGVDRNDLVKKLRGDDKSMDELHKRVDELKEKK